MEYEWADWTDEGLEVKLKVELDPTGSNRATDIFSKYEVIDLKTKKRCLKENIHLRTQQVSHLFEFHNLI
jgi:hypothetical protein